MVVDGSAAGCWTSWLLMSSICFTHGRHSCCSDVDVRWSWSCDDESERDGVVVVVVEDDGMLSKPNACRLG